MLWIRHSWSLVVQTPCHLDARQSKPRARLAPRRGHGRQPLPVGEEIGRHAQSSTPGGVVDSAGTAASRTRRPSSGAGGPSSAKSSRKKSRSALPATTRPAARCSSPSSSWEVARSGRAAEILGEAAANLLGGSQEGKGCRYALAGGLRQTARGRRAAISQRHVRRSQSRCSTCSASGCGAVASPPTPTLGATAPPKTAQNQHKALESRPGAPEVLVEPLAQLAEHLTFNQGVLGSIPRRLTTEFRRTFVYF